MFNVDKLIEQQIDELSKHIDRMPHGQLIIDEIANEHAEKGAPKQIPLYLPNYKF